MPSSTSSSNDRLPGGPSKRILALALALAIAFSASYEAFLRFRGFAPSVTDDMQLWSLIRSEVRRDDPKEVVLIGASRTQADIDRDVFTRLFNGRRPRQLAIAGTSPLPILKHFSQDESFKGLIVCDVMPIYFFTGIDWTGGAGAAYVAHAQRDTPWDRTATRFRVFLESHLALRAPDVAPSPGTLMRLVGLRPFLRQSSVVDAERYTHIDRRPEEVSPEAIAELVHSTDEAQPASQQRLERDLASLNMAVRRLQARGARVIFTVLPTSGPRREADARRFPRAKFWEKFVARIEAPKVYFEDYPELSNYTCHDGSHLTSREAPAFTQSLVNILKTKLQST